MWTRSFGIFRNKSTPLGAAAGPVSARDPLEALKDCRRHIVTAGVFSLAINVLHLSAPLYMMQIYDRVVSSGSGMTLAMLTLMVLVAQVALAGLDRARADVLAAANLRLDRLLGQRIMAAMLSAPLAPSDPGRQALRDLDQWRQFAGGNGLAAIFDLPWMPLYVLIGFVLHWAIGFFALCSSLLLVGIAVASEVRMRRLSVEASMNGAASHTWAEACLRNASSVRAMGMLPDFSAAGRSFATRPLPSNTASCAAPRRFRPP